MQFSLFAAAALFVSAYALPAAVPESEESANVTYVELERRGKPVDYTQNYVAGGASVSFTPNQNAGTFGINFNTRADFVVGLGWRTGDSDPITYGGSFSGSGVAILTIYGWTTNPLVEYYIMEYPTGYPKSGQQKGTFTSDGATYEIWEHQQVNQPSIQGTSTFNQYISIRTSPRTSGTVTVANHFNAWKQYGMNLGSQNYQTLSVESWSGSGQGSLNVAKGTSSGGGGTGGGGTGGGGTGGGGTGGGGTGGGGGSGTCSAIYGQCGGKGWPGPTCCSAGSCKASNDYYSQCL